MANCNGCGSKWDMSETAPVGSFPPNRFGLYDVAGNIMTWLEDCGHASYDGAPTDGSVWKGGNCSIRAARAGSWSAFANQIRSADRPGATPTSKIAILGFRVARDLSP
jgi:formylglycine-generating enzyme required for sulfatase activity